MRKLLRKQRFAPSVLVTNKLLSYGAARHEIATSAAWRGHVSCSEHQPADPCNTALGMG